MSSWFCLLSFAASSSDRIPSHLTLLGAQAQVHPHISASTHGQEAMVLDTVGATTWMWVQEFLDSVGFSHVGGIGLSAALDIVPAPSGDHCPRYTDGSTYGCSSWIQSTFRIGGQAWTQSVGLVTEAPVASITESAGAIGANPGSAFTRAVKVFGIEPLRSGQDLGVMFFHDIESDMCHERRVSRLPVPSPFEYWVVDSKLVVGEYTIKVPVLFDTGSTFIVLPSAIYKAFVAEIHSRGIQINKYSDELTSPGIVPCTSMASLPTLSFEVSSTGDFIIMTPKMYADEFEGDCSVYVADGGEVVKELVILGTPVFRHYTVAFNAKTRSVGICIPKGVYRQDTYGPELRSVKQFQTSKSVRSPPSDSWFRCMILLFLVIVWGL